MGPRFFGHRTSRQEPAGRSHRLRIPARPSELDPKGCLFPQQPRLGNCRPRTSWTKPSPNSRRPSSSTPSSRRPTTTSAAALQAKNQLEEAIGEYRKSIELDPKVATAHYDLGRPHWGARGQFDEAIVEFKKAIELDPRLAMAHTSLSGALTAKKLGAKLADVLAGKATATDNGERLGLAEVCTLKRRQVGAARFYSDAFTADPKLADDLKAGHRYNAACSAALAAAGQGMDADKLDDHEHRRLRQQALAWLRADVEQWAKQSEAGKPEDRQDMRAMLEHWQRDTDLASVRDADALNKLTAQEQEAWRKLWADVAELLKKTGDAKS